MVRWESFCVTLESGVLSLDSCEPFHVREDGKNLPVPDEPGMENRMQTHGEGQVLRFGQ